MDSNNYRTSCTVQIGDSMQGSNQPEEKGDLYSPFCDPAVALLYLQTKKYNSVSEVRADYYRALSAWYKKRSGNGKA